MNWYHRTDEEARNHPRHPTGHRWNRWRHDSRIKGTAAVAAAAASRDLGVPSSTEWMEQNIVPVDLRAAKAARGRRGGREVASEKRCPLTRGRPGLHLSGLRWGRGGAAAAVRRKKADCNDYLVQTAALLTRSVVDPRRRPSFIIRDSAWKCKLNSERFRRWMDRRSAVEIDYISSPACRAFLAVILRDRRALSSFCVHKKPIASITKETKRWGGANVITQTVKYINDVFFTRTAKL